MEVLQLQYHIVTVFRVRCHHHRFLLPPNILVDIGLGRHKSIALFQVDRIGLQHRLRNRLNALLGASWRYLDRNKLWAKVRLRAMTISGVGLKSCFRLISIEQISYQFGLKAFVSVETCLVFYECFGLGDILSSPSRSTL